MLTALTRFFSCISLSVFLSFFPSLLLLCRTLHQCRWTRLAHILKTCSFHLFWSKCLHTFIQHLKSLSFHHLSSIEHHLCTFLHTVKCPRIQTSLHNHLIDSFHLLVIWLIDFEIINKDAQRSFCVSISWRVHHICYSYIQEPLLNRTQLMRSCLPAETLS